LEKIGPTTKSTFVAFEQALDLGHCGIRFEFVIDRHDLDIAASHLAAEILDRERETVADLLAERRRRTGQGHDHADLELFLSDGLTGRSAQQNRQSGQLHLLLHDLSPDRPQRSRNSTPRQIRAFKT
jgi:hypothetical protein